MVQYINLPMAKGGGGVDAPPPQQVFPTFLGNAKSFSCKLNFYLWDLALTLDKGRVLGGGGWQPPPIDFFYLFF